MKSLLKQIILAAGMTGSLFSCNLDVEVVSELTPVNFPSNAEQFDAATGGVYSRLASGYADIYWRTQELTTDAAIIPARDGNWDDGGQYRELHKHTWTPENQYVKETWKWAYNGINAVNSTMVMLEGAPESEVKTMKIAQIRFMRALYYFFLMDIYGNVPVLKSFGDKGQTEPRAEVFAYIEQELKDIAGSLPAERTLETYARPTRWCAYALLAKIYLNAQVYAGVPRNDDAIAACDAVISSSLFALDEDYFAIFAPDNGPSGQALQIRETIFAVWYDPYKSTGCLFSRYSLHPYMDLVGKYSLSPAFRPSNCQSTLLEFYLKYGEPENDKRMKMWLRGPQYDAQNNPIIIRTTKGALDYNTPDAQKAEPVDWHFGFSDLMTLRTGSNPEAMDVGKDLLGDAKGIRNIKFWPDPNMDASSRNSSNNIPVFRYADILMMKAEAILRGGAPTLNQTATGLVNMIRERAGTSQTGTVTLEVLREERAREFVWEAWRRNDMIRFGEFGKIWELKDAESPAYRQLFPIPYEQLRMNSALRQNEGYPGL
ncbi:MAG: RagB/SusD family nutrient uptake outer membrane protein [Tannerella sp.]|jgi:hypothetical protein|nr:RagB/SusD family nutrient uptake outer membrane protein [Tannerella sp.]